MHNILFFISYLFVASIYGTMFGKMTKWWLQIPFIWWLTGEKKKIDYYIDTINNLCSEILEKRQRALAKGENVEDDARGIVDRLILNGELTEKEIKQQTFILFTTVSF